jgi:hypothetical protein
MKLRQTYIDFIANLLVDRLVAEGYIEPATDPKLVKARVSRIITEDLQLEDKLDEEVRVILESYVDVMRKENIPYHEMFRKVKQELVKKRNLVL